MAVRAFADPLMRWVGQPMLACSHWGMFPGSRLVAEYQLVPIRECTEFWEWL